jgi:hypothetical protein
LRSFASRGTLPARRRLRGGDDRQRTLHLGARLKRKAEAPPKFAPPTEAQSISLAIDGGHVKAVRSYQGRSFEVFVAQVSNDDGKPRTVQWLLHRRMGANQQMR